MSRRYPYYVYDGDETGCWLGHETYYGEADAFYAWRKGGFHVVLRTALAWRLVRPRYRDVQLTIKPPPVDFT